MKILHRTFIGILVVLVIVLLFIGITDLKTEQNSELPINEEPGIGLVENMSIPNGWYAHYMSDTNVMLTRQPELPDIGHTEGYAYGEQINISTSAYSGEPEAWEQLAWTKDETRIQEMRWDSIGGIETLHLRHEAGGAAGDTLTYYLFTTDTVHILSLYPVEETENLDLFINFVHDYAREIGTDTTADTNTYTNTAHNFSLSYPADWHEGSANRDNLFQLYNYDVSSVNGSHTWPPGYNKIEGVVATDTSILGPSRVFTEEERTEIEVTVAGKTATRTDVTLSDGNQTRSYVVFFDDPADQFLITTIYGDPANFHVLNTVVETLRFNTD